MDPIREIAKLFEDGDRSLLSADQGELRRIYADDYVQYDEKGNVTSRTDLIELLSTGKIRFRTMKSTGRNIRLLTETVAVVHGSEKDEVEQNGVVFPVAYVYTDVVIKRNGQWQIVVSQLAKGEVL